MFAAFALIAAFFDSARSSFDCNYIIVKVLNIDLRAYYSTNVLIICIEFQSETSWMLFSTLVMTIKLRLVS